MKQIKLTLDKFGWFFLALGVAVLCGGYLIAVAGNPFSVELGKYTKWAYLASGILLLLAFFSFLFSFFKEIFGKQKVKFGYAFRTNAARIFLVAAIFFLALYQIIFTNDWLPSSATDTLKGLAYTFGFISLGSGILSALFFIIGKDTLAVGKSK